MTDPVAGSYGTLRPLALVSRSLPSRVAALALVLLQLFAAGVVPSLDAQVEASVYGAVAHVEELGGTDCPVSHHQDECQLCRVLRAGATTPPSPPVLLDTAARLVGVERVVGGIGSAAISAAARPRAPPV